LFSTPEYAATLLDAFLRVRLAMFNLAVANNSQGMVQKFKDWWSNNGNVKTRFQELKETVERATERIIKLMVIFLLQTLVIPLLLLWVLYGIARGAFERPTLTSS
jgi:hypothetical protein